MKERVKRKASDAGFAACGITTAEPVDAKVYIDEAVASGRTADMGWLARNPAGRCDPQSLMPGARSVICCALGYGPEGVSICKQRKQCQQRKQRSSVARFARGADYHEIVREKLGLLWDSISRDEPKARAKLCVDTSPILEKALAQRAGLGWIGKHTILLNEKLGSWFMLGEIVTDLEIEPDAPAEDMCGDCRVCIDACPTGALLDARTLDSRKCISYLTIEAPRSSSASHGSRLPVNDSVAGVTMHGFSYGCDICQGACPFNQR